MDGSSELSLYNAAQCCLHCCAALFELVEDLKKMRNEIDDPLMKDELRRRIKELESILYEKREMRLYLIHYYDAMGIHDY